MDIYCLKYSEFCKSKPEENFANMASAKRCQFFIAGWIDSMHRLKFELCGFTSSALARAEQDRKVQTHKNLKKETGTKASVHIGSSWPIFHRQMVLSIGSNS